MSDSEEKKAPAETPIRTIFVAVAISLVASIAVAGAAVMLKPTQELNKSLAKKKIILEVAGLMEDGADVEAFFQEKIEPRLVDLSTGQFTDVHDANTFDQRTAAKDPALSIVLTKEQDIASIKRQSKFASVYLVKDGDSFKNLILPVHGYGLWSTLYGFLALEPDMNTVAGLQFYEHAETPGLGGEIDNPRWRSIWEDKKVFHPETGNVEIAVLKSPTSEDHHIDALAGATLTAVGVHNLVQFWVGDDGFGPFLKTLKEEGGI